MGSVLANVYERYHCRVHVFGLQCLKSERVRKTKWGKEVGDVVSGGPVGSSSVFCWRKSWSPGARVVSVVNGPCNSILKPTKQSKNIETCFFGTRWECWVSNFFVLDISNISSLSEIGHFWLSIKCIYKLVRTVIECSLSSHASVAWTRVSESYSVLIRLLAFLALDFLALINTLVPVPRAIGSQVDPPYHHPVALFTFTVACKQRLLHARICNSNN